MPDTNPYRSPESDIELKIDQRTPWPWWMLVAAFLLTSANFAALISLSLVARADVMFALGSLCVIFPIVCGFTVLILVDSHRFTLSSLGVFLSLCALSTCLDWGLCYLMWSFARGFESI